jgi:hypothetical protein
LRHLRKLSAIRHDCCSNIACQSHEALVDMAEFAKRSIAFDPGPKMNRLLLSHMAHAGYQRITSYAFRLEYYCSLGESQLHPPPQSLPIGDRTFPSSYHRHLEHHDFKNEARIFYPQTSRHNILSDDWLDWTNTASSSCYRRLHEWWNYCSALSTQRREWLESRRRSVRTQISSWYHDG